MLSRPRTTMTAMQPKRKPQTPQGRLFDEPDWFRKGAALRWPFGFPDQRRRRLHMAGTLQLQPVATWHFAYPGQLFYSTQIPVCLWFIGKNGNASAKHAAFKTAQTQNNAAMANAHSNFQLT